MSEMYQAEQAPGFCPYRRDVRYVANAIEAPIHPLLSRLSFIPDVQHWGMPFRRGAFAISREDFAVIARAMGLCLNA
ncbi:hypothetical protein HCZ23_06025 [Celeribacter sp. HF31]|uniref:hypothetical protein n=1 Tax=Celeribacter sp. HF31 TaxID=2721558 RepID=UPI0014307A08|nr:hypothetical protein [Celeribacter sp. HF31]NIY79023.1 hypothetical protein [Celeribacter sp. HF31]